LIYLNIAVEWHLGKLVKFRANGNKMSTIAVDKNTESSVSAWLVALDFPGRVLGQESPGRFDMSNLLRLQSWPNLTCMPDRLTEPLARICALLWRKPTVGYWVPKVMNLPADQTAALMQQLYAQGHLRTVGVPVAGASAAEIWQPEERLSGDAALADGNTAPVTPGGSLIRKLWQRLVCL
jgi:hypothetical protein